MARSAGAFRRFVLVGVIVAGIYVVLYLALLEMGVAKAVANIVAFLVAVIVQYVGQAAYTFEARLKDRRQITRFAAMIGMGGVTSTVITTVIGPVFGLDDWVAALAVTFVLPLQNFVLMRLWVFKLMRKESMLS